MEKKREGRETGLYQLKPLLELPLFSSFSIPHSIPSPSFIFVSFVSCFCCRLFRGKREWILLVLTRTFKAFPRPNLLYRAVHMRMGPGVGLSEAVKVYDVCDSLSSPMGGSACS
jgi:hypothetical protein